MATELAVAPFLTLLSTIDRMSDWLSCREVVEVVSETKQESELKRLVEMLSSVRGLAYDAERKQMRDKVVKQWLRYVNDAEDLFFGIYVQCQRRAAAGESGSSTSSFPFRPKRGPIRQINLTTPDSKKGQEHHQETKLQEIQDNKADLFIESPIDQVKKDKLRQPIQHNLVIERILEKVEFMLRKALGLREGVEVETTTTSPETTTTMEVEEEEESYHIYGRDADREAIIKSLLSDEDDEDDEEDEEDEEEEEDEEDEEESYHIYGRDADREAIIKSLLSDEDDEDDEEDEEDEEEEEDEEDEEDEEESYHIYGRDADREAIIKSLLSDEDDEEEEEDEEDEEEEEGGDKICVIPIAGISGIGKTTLARLVYTDIDNRKRFDVKTWITVSNEYDNDVFTLSKVIYERVTGSKNCCIHDTLRILLELSWFLQGKKILIVLDNVGNLNSQSWYEVKSSFESAASGSKMVVTTNNEHIASMLGTVPTHYLQLLSEKDCWQLFSNHAFNNVEASAYLNLEGIGRQIVKKCEGLPLAIKLIAGLLRTELNTTIWNNVLKNNAWNLPHKSCSVPGALWLSYCYLPPHLKCCFAYCSIFPKGYEFQKEKLILLWMAEDLLLPQHGKMLEEVGEEYFVDLTSRSFFRKSKFYGFTMHDLVHDLAQLVSREYCLRLEDHNSKILLRKIRHLSWTGNKRPNTQKLLNLSKINALRTLLRVDGWSNNKFLIHPKGLQNFQYLRVLSLYRVDAVTELLDSIGKLKLLKYLDLSWTEINEIPSSICSLYNLQTLLLQHCYNLSHLPDSIGNMKHLRHLDLSNTQVEEIPDALCNLLDLHTLLLGSCRKLTCLPMYMARLINLRHLDIRATSLREIPLQITNCRYLEILSDFVVGTSSASSIKVLGEVQDMHGNLSIRSLEKVVNVDDVVKANLKDEKCITDLSLEWKGDTDDSQKAREVLNRLQPHSNLEQISIINYGGISFSDWIADHSFSRLVHMSLSKCRRCHHLPPLGQLPSLKSLSIDGFDMLERIGEEFYVSGSSTVTKSFKSLEKLTFKFMPRWKEWLLVEGGVFSQLKELHLVDCPSLTLNGASFPASLPSLTHLYISKCQEQVVVSLVNGQLPLLSSLYIGYCLELNSFPERRLPINIHTIEICGCESLKSLSEEGWPCNLKSFSIGSCGKLFAPPMQWNLQTLTSLTSLDLSCIDEVVDSFPEEGKLPTTLISLTLCHLHNLKSLNGKAFQQLTSLEELSISYCKQLQCMPKEGLPPHLTSLHLSCLDNLKSLNGKAFAQLSFLEKLSISYCPQLRCIPEEGLPDSLSQLIIECCRFLIPRCQREIGADWPKIAHIPSIRTDPN